MAIRRTAARARASARKRITPAKTSFAKSKAGRGWFAAMGQAGNLWEKSKGSGQRSKVLGTDTAATKSAKKKRKRWAATNLEGLAGRRRKRTTTRKGTSTRKRTTTRRRTSRKK